MTQLLGFKRRQTESATASHTPRTDAILKEEVPGGMNIHFGGLQSMPLDAILYCCERVADLFRDQ
jgi:hypothetical protein